MKIGIDAREILDPKDEKGGGVARHTFTLVFELIKQDTFEFVLFLPEAYKSFELFKRNNVRIIKIPKEKIPFWDRHVTFSNILKKENLDLFHSPITSVPFFYSGKSVVTVHDLAIYVHPEWFPSGQWFSKKVLVPRSLKKASHILAVSESTKNDIISEFHVRSKKISVVYNMLPDERICEDQAARTNPPENPYLLFIGTLEPRKNLNTIFASFLELKKDPTFSDYSLCIIGREGWNTDAVFKDFSKEELVKKEVLFYDDINEREKREFLIHSLLLVYPSLYEGFGLPIIESQRAGVPVVTSDVSSMPEIAHGSAVPCNPLDVGEIRDSIKKVLTDTTLRDELIQKGYENVKRFESKKTIERILAIYKHLIT
ncbi:glycosyltransferase family 4 protein [Patescibacteria group bacterium]|nr:glycosyltransferase family 4 protein [Patescibacteria group bacterium]